MNSYNENADKEFKSRIAILTALSDQKWHRNNELKEKTKLSSRTLTKHIKTMNKLHIIDRKSEVINGKHAVLFKAKHETIIYYSAYVNRTKFITESKKVLTNEKDPLIILDAIHATSQVFFLELLNIIQQNKNITDEEIEFFGDCFLWTNYKQWTSELINTTRKITKDLNISQLLAKQAVRQTNFWKNQLRNYEKAA